MTECLKSFRRSKRFWLTSALLVLASATAIIFCAPPLRSSLTPPGYASIIKRWKTVWVLWEELNQPPNKLFPPL